MSSKLSSNAKPARTRLMLGGLTLGIAACTGSLSEAPPLGSNASSVSSTMTSTVSGAGGMASAATTGGMGGQAPKPDPCLIDEHVVDNVCVPCPPGYTSEAGADPDGPNTECTACEAGTFDDGENGCSPCEPGHVSMAAAESCTPCAKNSYEKDGDCKPCPTDFGSDAGATACKLTGRDGHLSDRDYGYLFWPKNHWINWNNYLNVQHVQTGYYALAVDVSEMTFDRMGVFTQATPVQDTLTQDNGVVQALPAGAVRYEVVENMTTTRPAKDFLNAQGKAANPTELIDMGRFMQRFRVPEVTYTGSTQYKGTIQLAALPRHFTLHQGVTSSNAASNITVRIEMDGAALDTLTKVTFIDGTRAVTVDDGGGTGWTFIMAPQNGATTAISTLANGGLRFDTTYASVSANQTLGTTVHAVPSTVASKEHIDMLLNPNQAVTVKYSQLNRDGSGGQTLTKANWDAERGAYLVALGDLKDVGAPKQPNWTNESLHNWYNRHRVTVEHQLAGKVSVPLAFDGGNNAAFYITGGSPLLRDINGEPLGAPLQISKNWHENPFWYHLYGTLEFEPGTHEFEHTFAHARWGKTYAAQHAQLALVGWPGGQNQQWDESSLGAWGESITYDPDMTLGRATVDDVRPFLVQSKSKWNWTGNVGGASFLVYEPNGPFSSFASHQLGRMRTHYAYTGPNLTNVTYSGVSADGKIESSVATQLGRTDDMVRAYYHLEYTFLDDVDYKRLALFQVAADRYADNRFTRHAYGNETKVTFDAAITNHQKTGYVSHASRGIALDGKAPWVMLYGSSAETESLPEHVANIGFIVRDYEAKIGAQTITTPHINIVRTYNGNPKRSQMGFELGVPFDANNMKIPKGSTIRATIEYVVPPALKSAYYGKSDYLTMMPAAQFEDTDMMLALAAGNTLDVTATIGAVVRSHPVELSTVALDTDGSDVAAQFELTGGLGYTPVTFHGLVRADGWTLEKEVGGMWEKVDQSVEGNDYWQAYHDASTGLYDLIFNVHNRAPTKYRLTR